MAQNYDNLGKEDEIKDLSEPAPDDKQQEKASRFVIAAKISLWVGVASLILCSLFSCIIGEKYGAYFIPLALASLISASLLRVIGYFIYLFREHITRPNLFHISSITCVFLGLIICLFTILFVFLMFIVSWRRLIEFSLLYLLVLAPLLGLIASIISFQDEGLIGQILTGLIFIMIIPPMIFGRFFLIRSLPCIYTPPALTFKKLAVYKECIRFVKNHDEHKNLTLLRKGYVSLDGNSFFSETWPRERQMLKEAFSEDEMIRIKELGRALDRIMCPKFQRCGSIVIFYKSANSLVTLVGPELYNFLPQGCGLLYSLNGENPNEIDNEVFNAAKPFIHITGAWYMSRCLMLGGWGSKKSFCTPKSLIDHSLHLDGIDPNELQTLDQNI